MKDALWAGTFGDKYVERNAARPDRSAFWASFYKKYPVRSVLELGCGSGHNLRYAEADKVYGIDINEKAVEAANLLPRAIVLNQSVFERLFFRNTFELVFTCGMLIHISPKDLLKAIAEMVRISSKYVLAMEYEAGSEMPIRYRGHRAALWKRPYGRIISSYMAEQPIDHGFLRPADGFDCVTWHLFRKP